MADTDSEDISVIMLTTPSQMITGDSRNAAPGAAGRSDSVSFRPPLRSAIEMYKGCLVPGQGLGLVRYAPSLPTDSTLWNRRIRTLCPAVYPRLFTIAPLPSPLYHRPLRGFGWHTGQV